MQAGALQPDGAVQVFTAVCIDGRGIRVADQGARLT